MKTPKESENLSRSVRIGTVKKLNEASKKLGMSESQFLSGAVYKLSLLSESALERFLFVETERRLLSWRLP